MRNRSPYPLDQSPLFKLRSRSRLAALLGVSDTELRALSVGDALYSEFDIPKKSGTGVRHVENPCRALKRVQAKLAKILARIDPPEFLFCPVKKRCYVTNAAAHKGNRVVQCLDIQKFFPSATQRKVFWFFSHIMQCERDIAGLLSNLVCYREHLPTGSPSSPIMAYFAYYDLWGRIATFCKERGHTFTVYIDDVTISGTRVPKVDIWQVRKMIHGAGLRYHKMKTFVDQPAEITGVVLREGQLVAPFRQHKKMHEARALLANADDDNRQALLGKLAGISGQIRQIAAKN